MRGRRPSKGKVLLKQRVRRKRRFRAVTWVARFISSAFVKLCFVFSLVTLISLLFVYSYHFLLSSPVFGLKRLEITGVDGRGKQRIMEQCDLRLGVNILALRLNDIKKKIEKDPWIRSARVERRLPDTIHISVVKEQVWAVVLAERLYYMNQWGEIFKEVEHNDSVDFPVVTGLSEVGSEAGGELKRVARVLYGLKKERGPLNLANLSEVHITDAEHFSLYFRGIPAEVQMGPGGVEIQLAKLHKLVRHLKRSGRLHEARRINLEYAGGAVVSFGKG